MPYKIPHMGWNSLQFAKKSPLLEGVEEGAYVYFVHSFQAYPGDGVLSAWCDYGTQSRHWWNRGPSLEPNFIRKKAAM